MQCRVHYLTLSRSEYYYTWGKCGLFYLDRWEPLDNLHLIYRIRFVMLLENCFHDNVRQLLQAL
jgi:hypothetical protein